MTPPSSPLPTLNDGHHRRINYLRLSITDRCDLRCQYCMPAEGAPTAPREDRLTDDELLAVARVAVELGIRKIRVTGGEPLVHPDPVGLLSALRRLPELERLVLTTNGVRLAPYAEALRAAGVEGVNVSIDSLQPDRYRDITRGGDLTRCRAGIDAALAAGFHVKLNVVVMGGVNDDEVLDFAALAQDLPLTVRFIEFMPTGPARNGARTVPSDELLSRIGTVRPLTPVPHEPGGRLSGPARNFRWPDARGMVGVISPVSQHFCASCNRIRVGADGTARGCLFVREPVDLKRWLRSGDLDGLAAALRGIVGTKPEQHDLAGDGGRRDDDPLSMSQLGG